MRLPRKKMTEANNDLTILDATDPIDLASDLDRFSHQYAKRTGNYEMSNSLFAAAEWLIFLSEKQTDKRHYQMDINNILTEDFQVTVVREFCKLHAEIAEDEAVREACNVVMEYCKPVTD
tara:strand:+ start:1790 stop:2149 length:360 start_codon:yes stop_codon:yes gene_type:complete